MFTIKTAGLKFVHAINVLSLKILLYRLILVDLMELCNFEGLR